MATTKNFSHRSGDGWPGFEFRPSVNGDYLTDLANATIVMTWASVPSMAIAHSIDLDDGFTVDARDGEEWVVADRQGLPLGPGLYAHRCTIIQDGDTLPDTIIIGETTVV